MKRMLTPLAAAALYAAILPGAAAQSDQRIVVPLSDPRRPATLEVAIITGSIAVTGYEGNEIVISAPDIVDEEPERGIENGLHRIPNTAMGLTAEERNNTVSIALDGMSRGRDIELSIQVPRRTSVHASTVNGGELSVQGVTGEHELSNVNGDIQATDLSGSAVVGTTNGDVQVSFTALTPGKAMSFASFNGDVNVTFPASLAADLRINAGHGDVLTDFDAEVQPQSPVVERSGDAGRYRVRLERDVRAIVGGGGPEMHFETFNGDIIIRKR